MENKIVEMTETLPTVTEYLALRQAAGLSARDPEFVQRGLDNGIYGVFLRAEERLIGMGRIIGDGGTAFQIVDVAVHPEYQGQGLGKKIMAALQTYIEQELPNKAYISLIADGNAQFLYQQFGFVATAPLSVGMFYKRA